MSTFAERIRNLRQELGLSQDELAEIADVNQNAISRYERGVNDPTSEVVIKLARALNTSTDYLLGLTDDPSSQIQENGLAPQERQAIAAWRRGDKMEAMRIIMDG